MELKQVYKQAEQLLENVKDFERNMKNLKVDAVFEIGINFMLEDMETVERLVERMVGNLRFECIKANIGETDVVRPVYDECYMGDGSFTVKRYFCSCENRLVETDVYCSKCGKKILWNKLTKK